MTTPQQPGFKLSPGDIIYTIFRHLKKIIFFAVLGVVAGAVVYKTWPKMYQSSAKLMIRFVAEDRETGLTDQETRLISTGGRGNTHVLAAERAIIASLDLAKEVADAVGPAVIIDDPERQATTMSAAGAIVGNLDVVIPRGSNIIELNLRHKNREIAKTTLEALIAGYLKKHVQIHRKSEIFDDILTRETDQMRMRLQQTEEEIRQELNKANIISIGDAKSSLATASTEYRSRIIATRTELAELNLAIKRQEEALKNSRSDQTANPIENSDNVPTAPIIEDDKFYNTVRLFNDLREKLNILNERKKELTLKFTSENTQVKSLETQIKSIEQQITELRRDNPDLQNTVQVTSNSEFDLALSQETQLRNDKLKFISLESRLSVYTSQLAELMSEAGKLERVELVVNELNRRKALQESKYRSLLESMEKQRVQEELGEGRINNISILQTPSPAYTAANQRNQFAAGIAAGIGILGLVWAFLTDLLLDRTIKRPTEIQRNLGIPLFMSMPDLNDKRNLKVRPGSNRALLQQAGRLKALESKTEKTAYKPKSPTLQAAALTKPEEYGSKETEIKTIAAWDDQHALNEHFEALRDKVITYFESKNLTHKPKLIAMTGLGKNSGVTTIASGLAGSLSKIGEGSVLLIDMTLGHETAQQFYQGKNILNLDEVLDSTENSAGAKMNNNLYVVAEGTNGTKLPRIMPQRFNAIIPKLKASDFEYIIFDMPPVSAISSTPRLAAFMDIVLMVMESEKTNRDVANQALELLADSKTHLGAILNKTKAHVPKRLEQDLLSQA